MRALLVRHAASERPEVLGRRGGAKLTPHGRLQALNLAWRLRSYRPEIVYSSPLARALETASILGRALPARVQSHPALAEVEFGVWDGKIPAELNDVSEWRLFNEHRSRGRCPGGESMAQVQRRVVSFLSQLVEVSRPAAAVVCVTHLEVIRAAALGVSGRSLDRWFEIDVSPAGMLVMDLNKPWTAAVC